MVAGPAGETPRNAVANLVTAHGTTWVIDRCLEVVTKGDVDAELLVGLSGRHAELVLQGREGGVEGSWPKVWSLRALLYVWEARAASAVKGALRDESWRVREMALKVMVRRQLRCPDSTLASLVRDPNERVRNAAARLEASIDVKH